MKRGSKANLNAKSCSDNSELAKNNKLLRMQKFAPNEKNWCSLVKFVHNTTAATNLRNATAPN